ncbi:hypothetical protein KI387_008006 [Taxus chinensis]|uniref:Uncharacterized protein n=1 Tax=Taxus chinensis TaxID=29808 RepID=A0AA38CPL2_TAXCH|nr:hypothetical protein KI387_008006 [Taxus chinensis]
MVRARYQVNRVARQPARRAGCLSTILGRPLKVTFTQETTTSSPVAHFSQNYSRWNWENESYIVDSSRNGFLKHLVIEELLMVSPDIIAFIDDQGNTPLHVASYRGHLGIVKQLISSFPSLLTPKNNDGNNILHMVVVGFRASGFRRIDKQMDLVRHLILDKNIDVPKIISCKNKEGIIAMHLVVLGKVIHKKLVELLLSAPGLNINICDKHGMSVVDILELNLVSGITSNPLLKQLALAGGRPMHSEDSYVSNANISYGKIH